MQGYLYVTECGWFIPSCPSSITPYVKLHLLFGINCVKKLFNEISTAGVKYHEVDSYQNLLDIMETL